MKLSDRERANVGACISALREVIGNLVLTVKWSKNLPVEIQPAHGIESPVLLSTALLTTQKLVEHQLNQLLKIQEEKGKN